MLSPACLGRLSLTVPSLLSAGHLSQETPWNLVSHSRVNQWHLGQALQYAFNCDPFLVKSKIPKIYIIPGTANKNRSQDSVVQLSKTDFIRRKDLEQIIFFSNFSFITCHKKTRARVQQRHAVASPFIKRKACHHNLIRMSCNVKLGKYFCIRQLVQPFTGTGIRETALPQKTLSTGSQPFV